jgi:hypothetical protein
VFKRSIETIFGGPKEERIDRAVKLSIEKSNNIAIEKPNEDVELVSNLMRLSNSIKKSEYMPQDMGESLKRCKRLHVKHK